MESIKDDPYSTNSSNKQSVVLRYLGDESEEVLYSVNAKDLVVGLGLDSTMTSLTLAAGKQKYVFLLMGAN